jgi:hypothetical protein
MLKADVHPKILSERLRHSTIAITLDTYSHIVPDMQRDAAKALDRLLAIPYMLTSAASAEEEPSCGNTGGACW